MYTQSCEPSLAMRPVECQLFLDSVVASIWEGRVSAKSQFLVDCRNFLCWILQISVAPQKHVCFRFKLVQHAPALVLLQVWLFSKWGVRTSAVISRRRHVVFTGLEGKPVGTHQKNSWFTFQNTYGLVSSKMLDLQSSGHKKSPSTMASWSWSCGGGDSSAARYSQPYLCYSSKLSCWEPLGSSLAQQRTWITQPGLQTAPSWLSWPLGNPSPRHPTHATHPGKLTGRGPMLLSLA